MCIYVYIMTLKVWTEKASASDTYSLGYILVRIIYIYIYIYIYSIYVLGRSASGTGPRANPPSGRATGPPATGHDDNNSIIKINNRT